MDDRDKPFDDVKTDPRIQKAMEYVSERITLDKKYGLKPRQAVISPYDELLCRLGTICGLTVVQDYNMAKGRIELR